jgi:ABC-type branched-subunit amino acid transport system substrate-binding protein
VPEELDALRSAGLSAERGAALAIEELGEQGRAVRLVTVEVEGPWSTAAQIARDLMVGEGADAVLTLLDHAGSHAAAQVATKLRRPLVTVNDPSVLLHYTGVPWVAGPRAAIAPESFESRYLERYGEVPDETARSAYLATGRLLAALDRGTERLLAPAPSPIGAASAVRAESTPSPGS